MHQLSTFEYAAGCVTLLLAIVFIVVLIGCGMKLAADARIEEVEKSVQRKAERMAHEIVRECLDGVQIRVTQRISVVEDDLQR